MTLLLSASRKCLDYEVILSEDGSICHSIGFTLDFFCSGIQFYLLLSPYLCFIFLLYLELFIPGDNAFIS